MIQDTEQLLKEAFKSEKRSKQIERNRDEDANEIQKIDRILATGLAIVIIISPLLVKAHVVDFISPLITNSSFDTGTKVDVFTSYKYYFLIFSTVILGIIFLYKIFALGYELPKSWLNVFVTVLTITIVLSAVFAPFKTIAMEGMYNRHDGTISYLCYISLFYIAANIKYTSKTLKAIIYSLVPFILINVILGVLNFNGHNILEWEWLSNLLYGGLQEEFTLEEGSTIWSTLNNPNYISGFAGTLASLFFTLAIVRENLLEKVIYLIISIVSFLMILTSFSTSGFLALLITVPLILVLAFLSKSKIKALSVWIIGVIAFVLVLNTLAGQNSRVWNESIGFLISKNPYIETQESMKKMFEFDFENRVSAAEEEFELKKLPEPGVSPGSGRLYIWEKSFEMIKERPIFGYGLDTFVYHFPQDDPEKQAGLGTYNITVDKTHNLYLGLTVGSGVISLFAFIGLVSLILFKWVKEIFNRKRNTALSGGVLGLGMFMITFLIQAMFNDSIIGFTNVMFILIGVLASETIYNRKLEDSKAGGK